MQRFLSLITLGIIAAFGWIFLQGGGLNQLGTKPQAQPSQTAPNPGWGTASGSGGEAGYSPLPTSNVSPQPAGAVLRIASFNIEAFGNKKAGKTPVILTLVDIVRQFDVVAIQEVRSQNDYLIPNFVKLVNQPSSNSPVRRFDHVIGPRIGNTTTTEQYAFLFDTDKVEIDPYGTYTVGDPDNLLHREPFVASFRARGVDPSQAFTFTLVNFHIDPDVVPQELDVLAEVYRVVRRSGRNEDDVILLGDFNTDDRHLYRLGQVPGIYPLISGEKTNTRQTEQYDNIIIHGPSTTEYTGRAGVYDVVRRYNITEAQALEVSDHFPIWAEFSVFERDASGRIAQRPGTTVGR